VGEVVVGDLDPVLVLELLDGLLADVLVPVEDEELLLGCRHRRRRRRGRGHRGRGALRRRLGGGRGARARRPLATRDQELGECGGRAECGDASQELSPAPVRLGQLLLERLVEAHPRQVPLGHDASSTVPDRSPSTRASVGAHANTTESPDEKRDPVLAASTDKPRPPAVRTWYWTAAPR